MNTQRATIVTILVLLALVAGTNVAATEIYHWVDEDGVQHFSQYPPTGNVANVSSQKLVDATPPGDGKGVYDVEAHQKQMAAWREKLAKDRKEARERNRQRPQQPIRYTQPQQRSYWPYWYPPVYPRPPHKPWPPIQKPTPPSVIFPRGGDR